MGGTASADYEFQTTALSGRRAAHGYAGGSVVWGTLAAGTSPKFGAASGGIDWSFWSSKGVNGDYSDDVPVWRVVVQEIRGARQIVIPDLVVSNLVFQRMLSGPCDIQFDVHPMEPSVAGVVFQPWRQLIHIERIMLGKRRIWCTGIVQPSEIDEETGVLHLKAKGFASYPKGMPWLQNVNWIANDAFRPVVQIWNHLQSYTNGNLGVGVYPQTCGIIQLPGYAFDGDLLNLNFFATFVRARDKLDCGDYIDALARDIPFDYAERSQWAAGGTDVIKQIQLGYPRLGVIHSQITFVINENVIKAKPHVETQTDWVSDVGMSGFFPGVEYSYELSNADPNRIRRYLDEEAGFIDSNERAAAWGNRKLARRQTPPYWEEITIDMNHPNAPLGSYDIGDTISVSGVMPWHGEFTQAHKIMSIAIDASKNECVLRLKAEGAFNYDPIYFPNGNGNVINNAGFNYNISGWNQIGTWSHDAGQGANHLGSARTIGNGTANVLYTNAFGVAPFQIFPVGVSVKCSNAVSYTDSDVQILVQFYDEDMVPTELISISGVVGLHGMVPWRRLAGKVICMPPNAYVSVILFCGLASGTVWFDDAELVL